MRGQQHASAVGLITVPPIQACCLLARLVACLCGICPLEREVSMIGSQTVPHHAMAKQLSLVVGCAADPTIPCGLLHVSLRFIETLATGNV